MPIPIRGPLSIPLRLIGVKKSQMNPNLCTICETNFTKVKKKKQIVIPATILFADLRGYTSLSEKTERSEVLHLLHNFYDDCASAIWERDGIVNKFIGDAVLAIFNFPIVQNDHVRQAVLAAMEIQKRWMEATSERKDLPIGIGVGIHTGNASIGEVGTAYKDFTIIGPVVNLASRMQSAAGLGEVVVTEDVYHQVEDLFPQASTRTYQLKGIEEPVNGFLLR
ncbi:MAG TPA: adenylate/guanylate cyclase domain-containing protein [Acidobacteriota bacterium]|nr:adenylate/guanylate cyclase domain-containing protein [Acidobacteriota bacterium]